MVDVSNRTLSYIMVAAMFITVLSTAATLTRLDILQTERALTGYVSNPNATATLNITGATSIVFLTDTIDWGSGFVNESPMCNLTTQGIPGHRSGCGNFTDVGQPVSLTLNNDGNQLVNITVALNSTPEQWLGSSDARAYMNATENASNSGSACSVNLQSALLPVNISQVNLCETFEFNDANDTLDLGMKIELPSSAPPGQKTVRITATATAI